MVSPRFLLTVAWLLIAIHVEAQTDSKGIYAAENLHAWCAVPFDARQRGPEERAEMLKRLGFKRFAYDWRAKDIPTFDAEIEALKKRGIELTAWWSPTDPKDPVLKTIVETCQRHDIHPQLWVMGSGAPTKTSVEYENRVEQESERIRLLVEIATAHGCSVHLYNHNGWFGQPDNEVAVIERLKRKGITGVGMIYNFSHGHDDIADFPAIWKRIQPYVVTVNLTGMVVNGADKLMPPGAGDQELKMMKVIEQSGWKGPVGVIAEQGGDAEETLRACLQGVEKLKAQLNFPAPAFVAERTPLNPAEHPLAGEYVNRDRIYDFYAKEARFALQQSPRPADLPPYPGLDSGKYGHWGNQNEKTWEDASWNQMEVGSLQAGVFRGWGLTVARGVCVRLGDRGEMAACFDPDTLTWVAAWQGGFVRFSPHRHGFLSGCEPAGQRVELSMETAAKAGAFNYHGFYRNGARVIFAYQRDGQEWLESAWCEGGKFVRVRLPASEPAGIALLKPDGAQWPQVIETKGARGRGEPYVVDTIALPRETPWKSLFHFGDHDFFPDGDAAVCTIEGEVWLVRGIDASLEHVKWKRFAAGLHHPLGLKIVDGIVYVLGRDQITALRDQNGDGEADFYECFSNAYQTSAAGHDFITGLQCDASGRFIFASSNQGICRVSKDGKSVEVLGTGFRNPDGLGLGPKGEIIASAQEGEWTPASMLAEIKPGGHYGYRGPQPGPLGHVPPIVYLPRGLDNSCGGQVFVEGTKWGVPEGTMVHLSFGAGSALLIIRDALNPEQAGVVPLPGDFRSGAHRGRFHPQDGQLYVTGTAGWGTYTPDAGCFQRLRYTGGPVMAPTRFEARENGLLLTFTAPLDPVVATKSSGWLVQSWNYRYGPAYGSDEYSVRRDQPGHEVEEVTSAHVLPGNHTLFLEIPQLPVANTVHVYAGEMSVLSRDLFFTLHRLGPPFTEFPGYRPVPKVAVHHHEAMTGGPLKGDPVKWEQGLPGRKVRLETTTGLQYAQRELTVKAGERISLTINNPDVMPHNWVLGAAGAVDKITDLANKLVTDPNAVTRHYVPDAPEVLVHTRLIEPASSTTIHFDAPSKPGDYPYLCTFPGHAFIMRGVMHVE